MWQSPDDGQEDELDEMFAPDREAWRGDIHLDDEAWRGTLLDLLERLWPRQPEPAPVCASGVGVPAVLQQLGRFGLLREIGRGGYGICGRG